MLGLNRWHLFKFVAAIVCIAGIFSLALIYFFPAPPSKIVMATGFKGGSYELLAARYTEILARHGVELEWRHTGVGWGNIEVVLDRNTDVQTAFLQGGVRNDRPAPGLLSLGRINYQIFCVFYRATETLDDLTELAGKRIAVGPVGTSTRVVAEKVLTISGATSENSTLLPLAGQAAVDALIEGKVDAVFQGHASDSPLIQSLLREPRIRLLSVTRAEALTRLLPILTRLVLPQGAIDFQKKIPGSDIVLFSTTNSVLVRGDLHPAHISLLAQALQETHSAGGLFQRAGEFPMPTDPEFPMAEGAVDFYKNGFPFLDRYLPHWIVPHFQRLIALLLAAGAIVFPVFSLAPKLFKSIVEYRLSSMYRRLREIEEKFQKDMSASEVAALGAELANIDREISILGIPNGYSDLFFTIKSHIDVVRIRLNLRRAELHMPVIKTA